jgi:hypothetical protein
MAAAIVFVAAGLLLCAAAVLAVFGIVHHAMAGSEALERDGLHQGARAPVWSLEDTAGHVVTSPPAMSLQMIVFTDHSLKHFPSVADGLKELSEQDMDLEIVVMLRRPSRIAAPVLSLLGLAALPVVTGSESLYARYNVRVTPWVILVDPAGKVRASSLVNHAWQVHKLRQLAGIALETGTSPAHRRPLRAGG